MTEKKIEKMKNRCKAYKKRSDEAINMAEKTKGKIYWKLGK